MRARLSCAEQRRGRQGDDEGPDLWVRGVSEGRAGARATHERSRCRAGPGCQGEDALRELQLPAGPVRERGEGRPSGPAGKEKGREGGPANGLWAGFQFHCFSYFHSFFFFKLPQI